MYVAKGSALSEDATDKLLAGTFDDGSLTCTLIGRPLELRLCGITLDDLNRVGRVGGRTHVHVSERFVEDLPNQKNRQIYFNFEKKNTKKNNVHSVKFYVSKLC